MIFNIKIYFLIRENGEMTFKMFLIISFIFFKKYHF